MALSPEHMAKMAEGRRLAREKREVAMQSSNETVAAPAPEPDVVEPMAMVEDEGAAPEAGEAFEPTPMTAFEVYMASLPDEARELLTEDELRQAFDDAAREARAERRKQLATRAKDHARSHARATEGLIDAAKIEQMAVAERNNRKVKVKIQLPFVSDTGGVAAEGVTLDGVTYYHGQEYTMPMARAIDIRRTLYCLQQNELDFEGKGRLHGLRRQHASTVNMVRI